MRGLAGKRMLVTGGGRGIGRAIALRFAEEGAHVAINDLDPAEGAEETARLARAAAAGAGHAVTIVVVPGDVADERSVERFMAEGIARLGGLDIAINNAGIQRERPSHEVSGDEFDRILDVTLRGSFLVAREAIRHFLDLGRTGVVLNNTSAHEVIPKPGYASYSAAKGAMRNVTRTLALEYAGRGIRVNAVAAGATVTPINQSWIDDPVRRAKVEAHLPMGRPGEAEEVAAAFAFLASDDAAYITGHTLYVDGGISLYADFRDNWAS